MDRCGGAYGVKYCEAHRERRGGHLRKTRREPIKGSIPADLPMSIYVNEVSKLFFDRINEELERIGVKRGYHQIIMHLAREDGKSQYELVKKTHFKASTISVALQKMEADGLVVRKTDCEDARQVRVYLTELGKELDDKIREKFDKTEKILLKGFSTEDEEKIKFYLMKMRENIYEEIN